METKIETFLAEREAASLGGFLKIAQLNQGVDVTLGGRLIQSGQCDNLAEPKILFAATERLEDLHGLLEGLDKQR